MNDEECNDCAAECDDDYECVHCCVPLCGFCAMENEDPDIGSLCASCAEMESDGW